MLQKFFRLPLLNFPNGKRHAPLYRARAGQLLFVLLCGPLWAARAQVPSDTHSIRHESQRLGINTFSVGTYGDYRINRKKGQHVDVQSGQFWVYNRALPSRRAITSNVWNRALFLRPLGANLIWENELWQYSFLANETRIALVFSRLRYRLLEARRSRLFLTGGAGLANDKRLFRNNAGLKAEGSGEFSAHSPDSGFRARASVRAGITRLNPRENRFASLLLSARREFEGNSLTEMEAGYITSRVEDFLGEDIQSIRNDTAFVRLRLVIPFSRRVSFESRNEAQTPNRSFFYRSVSTGDESRNVRYFQDDYLSQNTLRLRNKWLRLDQGFESRLRNRTYDIISRLDPRDPRYPIEQLTFSQRLRQERIKDIREQYTTYSTDARVRLNRHHSLRLHYVAQLLRVDTRSPENDQDRDEILYAAEMSHEWRLPFGMNLSNKVSASFRHLIFIEATQSSENFIDRIIRWEPVFRWVKGPLTWNAQMGIWATYQARDFESQADKNRSNRVLIFSGQLQYRLNARWKMVSELSRRENRLSQFSWKRFAERPIDTVVIYDLALRGRITDAATQGSKWALEAGYRAFWQTRKSQGSLSDPALGARLIYLRSYFVQQGPQIRFSVSRGNRLRLQGEFWLQQSAQFFRYTQSREAFLGTAYTAEQLGKKEQRFLPFFQIQGNWYFGRK